MADKTMDDGDTENRDGDEERRQEGDAAEQEDTVDESEEESEEEDEEEDEPKLKYARLTSHLAPIYRNGDATSCFMVGGDKMVGPGWGSFRGMR